MAQLNAIYFGNPHQKGQQVYKKMKCVGKIWVSILNSRMNTVTYLRVQMRCPPLLYIFPFFSEFCDELWHDHPAVSLWRFYMMDRDPSTSTNNKLQSNHIPTLSGTVSDSEKFGADLNNHLFHNHVRPDTADAAVMAKRSARSSERPNSAQQFIRGKAGKKCPPQNFACCHIKFTWNEKWNNVTGQSVEEVLELKSSPSSENVKSQNAATSTATKTAKTNNYFPKVLRSNYNKTASALVAGNKPDQIISQNGSPKTQSSPAQSLLTLPTGEPSTHEHIGSHGGGVSDVASVQNGKTYPLW